MTHPTETVNMKKDNILLHITCNINVLWSTLY